MNKDKPENTNKYSHLICSQFNKEYLNIFIILLNKGFNKLSYTILYILINITFYDEGEELFEKDENIINNIILFLQNNKYDPILSVNILWLIKHITDKNIKNRELLIKLKFIEFLDDIFEKYLLNKEFMDNVISCINNLIKSQNQNFIQNYINSIKIVKSQLIPNLHIDKLSKVIKIIFNLSNMNSINIYHELVNNYIHIDLMNVFPFFIYESNIKNYSEDQIKDYKICSIYILRIFGLLCSKDDKIIYEKLLNAKIANFYKKILNIQDLKLIKNVAFCMSNLCAGDFEQFECLFSSGALLELINVGYNIFEALNENFNFTSEYLALLRDAFREICYVMSLCIDNSIYNKIIPYLKYKNGCVILFLIKGMEIYENYQELILFCISALYKLNSYSCIEEDFLICVKKGDNENNLNYKDFVTNNGLEQVLEKLRNNNDKTIQENAERLCDSIFDKF